MTLVTLLTDFATRDGYVAALKGVIHTLAPEARLVDASHEIEPGGVEAAAWALSQYWALFPEGTVHLAVVDPGVGGGRRPMAVEVDGRFFVGPDNGLVTRVLEGARGWQAVELAETRYRLPEVSRTFHGRDVFAPAAAHIASGGALDDLGPRLDDPVRLDLPRPRRLESELRGHVVHVDRFGNLISDIPAAWTGPEWEFEVAGRGVGRLRDSYSDVEEGGLLAVVGSGGTVEVAVRGGSAAAVLGAGRGEEVLARRAGTLKESSSVGGMAGR